MARDFQINGETMVYVKGAANTAIANLTELGLAVDQVRITPNFRHLDIKVDAWGGSDGPPADVQWMLMDVMIQMTLVHFDYDVLEHCLQLSAGGPNAAFHTMTRAGARLGNNFARFEAGNRYIGLNLASPQGQRPWRFYFAYLASQPVTIPLGVERSLVPVTWRAIPYTQDPWGAGLGAEGNVIWDHVLDT